MTTSQLHPLSKVVQHLRKTALGRDGDGRTDGQLLVSFIDRRDEEAFEALVRRHGPMVMGVCRRVLGSAHDAEDAFQATFLVLVRKAASIVPRERVGNWLYGVAYRTALEARAMIARRRKKERQVQNAPHLQALPNHAWRELQLLVDQELSQLPEKYRLPIVLCELEGRSRRNVARQLDLPEGTLSSRLATAKRMLAKRLARRGLGISAVALIVTLSQTAASASVPASLVVATVKAAPLVAAGKTATAGVVSAQVAALTGGVLKAMFMSKVKIAAVVLLALGLVSAGTMALSHRALASEAPSVLQVGHEEVSFGDADEESRPKPKDKKKKVKADSSKQSQKVEEVVTKTFKTGSAPRLVVELHNGAIDLDASAKKEVSVRITKEAHAKTEEAAKEALEHLDVKMTQDGNKITVSATREQDKPTEASVKASAVIKVPAGAVLELNTHNGPVKVKGGKGSVRVQTFNGSIHVADNRAPQHLTTHNGPIIVTGATGKLELETRNGPIEISAENAVVAAKTNNGAVKFDGTLADGNHSLNTNNGRILLTLPADARFRIAAQTHLGAIKSGFQVAEGERKSKTQLSGTVGKNPATTITLQTHNGGIEILPKK
jgi:RNA polymerase sigma factor (sigma-70 family)